MAMWTLEFVADLAINFLAACKHGSVLLESVLNSTIIIL